MLESTFASWLRRSLEWLQSTSGWSAVHFGWDLRSNYYGRVQDACCSHLFDVLCCLHWTAHFPAFMAACVVWWLVRVRHGDSAAGSVASPRVAAFTAVSYWEASVWGVLAVSVLARGVSTGSEAWHVLVGYMERNDAAKNGVRRDR